MKDDDFQPLGPPVKRENVVVSTRTDVHPVPGRKDIVQRPDGKWETNIPLPNNPWPFPTGIPLDIKDLEKYLTP